MEKQLQMILEELDNIKNHESAEALTENKIKEICKIHDVSFEKLQDSVLEMFIDAGITEEEVESLSIKEMSNNDLNKISGGVSNTKRNAALLAAFLNLNSMAGSYAQNPITITKKPENNISAHTIAYNNQKKENDTRDKGATRNHSRIFLVLMAIFGIGGGGYLALREKQRTGEKLKEKDNALKQEKDALDAENDRLQRERETLKQEKDALDAENDRLQRERETLKQEKDALGQESKKLGQKNNRLENECNAFKGEQNALKENGNALKQENDRLQHECDALDQENNRLENQNKVLEQDNDRLQHECDALEQRNYTLDDENDKLNQEKQRLGEQNKRLENENTTLKQQCDRLTQQYATSEERNCTLQTENARLTQQCQSLNATITTLTWNHEAWKQADIDYWKIQNAIKDPTSNTLTAADVQRLQQQYQGNRQFEELLKILEKKIRRHTNPTKLTDTAALAYYANSAPPHVKDPKQTDTPLPVHNSGVYLWEKGYNVKSFLSNGGCGVAWKCTSKTEPSGYKVMKVLTTDPRTYEPEIAATNTVISILNHDTTGKAKRYLPNLRVVPKGSDYIIRSPLADGDLFRVFYGERGHSQRPNFDEVLRYAGQMLKSVKFLHDAGYTHNDIKPENFLRISTWPGKNDTDATIFQLDKILKSDAFPYTKIDAIQAIPNIYIFSTQLATILRNHGLNDDTKLEQIKQFVSWKQSHKHKLQLTDFGSLGKLGYAAFTAAEDQKTYRLAEWPTLSTPVYLCANDATILDQNGLWFTTDSPPSTYSGHAIKRDVYALGVTLMWLLIRYFYDLNPKTAVTNLQVYSPDPNEAAEQFRYYYNTWLTKYDSTTAPATQIQFIALIKKMVNPNIINRITLDAALAELQQIKKSRRLWGNEARVSVNTGFYDN